MFIYFSNEFVNLLALYLKRHCDRVQRGVSHARVSVANLLGNLFKGHRRIERLQAERLDHLAELFDAF